MLKLLLSHRAKPVQFRLLAKESRPAGMSSAAHIIVIIVTKVGAMGAGPIRAGPTGQEPMGATIAIGARVRASRAMVRRRSSRRSLGRGKKTGVETEIAGVTAIVAGRVAVAIATAMLSTRHPCSRQCRPRKRAAVSILIRRSRR